MDKIPEINAVPVFAVGPTGRGVAAGNVSAVADTQDRVEISEFARLLSEEYSLPQTRVERIAAIRAAIDRGDYLSTEKLDSAIERAIENL